MTNEVFSEKVKKDYISLIQAQMSNTELMITFFNVIEYDNQRYNVWLDEFGFFENLVTDNCFLDKLKQNYFSKTEFKHVQTSIEDPLETIQKWFDESQIDIHNETFYDTLARLEKNDNES